jgi:hypothetical protein
VAVQYQRRSTLDHFRESIASICSFVDERCDDNWKRALVTGICPCGAIFAVNNTRLQAFTNRSKSSINDLFSKLNYHPIAINQNNQGILIAKIPFLKHNYNELRQWTFRVEKSVAEIASLFKCSGKREYPATADDKRNNGEEELRSESTYEVAVWESLALDEDYFA